MMELEINEARQTIEPSSTKELREAIARGMPAGHLICQLSVDGRTLEEADLEGLEVGQLRSVAVRSASPQQIARASLAETAEWIGRICGYLDELSRDYRLGRESQANARLVDAVDALQVLASLLDGIRRYIDVQPGHRPVFERTWAEAERELQLGVEGLYADLETQDFVGLADRAGHALPRVLRRFALLLEGLQ